MGGDPRGGVMGAGGLPLYASMAPPGHPGHRMPAYPTAHLAAFSLPPAMGGGPGFGGRGRGRPDRRGQRAAAAHDDPSRSASAASFASYDMGPYSASRPVSQAGMPGDSSRPTSAASAAIADAQLMQLQMQQAAAHAAAFGAGGLGNGSLMQGGWPPGAHYGYM